MSLDHFVSIVSDISHIPTEQIKSTSHFQDDLGIDSLNMVNFFIQLSDRTNIPFERFVSSDDIKTVGSVYKIIQKEVL